MNNRSGKKFSRPKTIIFSLVIFIVLGAILETSSYFFLTHYAETGTFKKRWIQNPFHPFLGWTHQPNAHIKTHRPYSTGKNYIDTDGDGNSITPLSLSDPAIRVIFTGGSSSFGVGQSSNETTVASLLEKKIYQRLGISVEVTNLGVRSYQSFQEMLRLHEHLLDHNADIVIALSGHNDTHYARGERNIRNALLQDHVYKSAVPLVRAAELQKPILLNVDNLFSQYSYFFDLIARAFRRALGSNNPPKADLSHSMQIEMAKSGELFTNIPDRAKISLSHYKLMDVISQNNQARFYFILQPSAYTWAHYPGKIAPIIESQEYSMVEKKYANLYYDALINLAGDFPVYNLTNSIDVIESPMPYEDKIHYTDAGTSVLSDAIFDLIKPEILRIKEQRNIIPIAK